MQLDYPVDIRMLRRVLPQWGWLARRVGFGWWYEGTRDVRSVEIFPTSQLSGYSDDDFVTVWRVKDLETGRSVRWTEFLAEERGREDKLMSVSFYGMAGGFAVYGGGEADERGDWLNFSNVNAGALLELLGYKELWGEITLPEARRAVMYARATFERRAPRLKREMQQRCGPGGAQLISFGLDEAGLESRLKRFAAFVEAAAKAGATHITWG